MSKLFVDSIQPKTTGGSVGIKGHVLQMPFTQYTSTTSVSTPANTNTTIGVLTVDITPSSLNSIIKLDSHVFHEWQHAGSPYNCTWFFFRDSTKLAHPQDGNRLSGISASALSFEATDGGSTPETVYYSYFDSPQTTSLITYKVGVITHHATSVFINRTVGDSNGTESERGVSFISATEIGG